LKSHLIASDYPRAWAEYNQRWVAAWAIPLALVAVGLATEIVTGFLIAALVAYAVLYLRFVKWPCPRCGEPFTMGDAHRIVRSKHCINCGLARNTTPEEHKRA